MKNRLIRSVMVLAAIVIMISLTVALAPDASAQNSRPSAKDVETNTHAVPVYGMPKICCICISPGPIPSPDADAEASSETTETTPYSSPSRWFCMEYCRGIVQ
jgi:hypothetical protein